MLSCEFEWDVSYLPPDCKCLGVFVHLMMDLLIWRVSLAAVWLWMRRCETGACWVFSCQWKTVHSTDSSVGVTQPILVSLKQVHACNVPVISLCHLQASPSWELHGEDEAFQTTFVPDATRQPHHWRVTLRTGGANDHRGERPEGQRWE